MNAEEIRLQTFLIWPEDAPVEGSRIAKGGFFATGNGLEVQCHWCGSKISEWEYGDQVMGKHRRLKPDCPFVLNPTSSGNIPLNNVQPSASDSSALIDLKNEQYRLLTFNNWPVPFISPQSLAKAGFYYFNQTDHVRCAWCHGIIAKWEVGDNPFTEHLRLFPTCPRAQIGPNVEIQREEPIRSLGIQQIRTPKTERFSSLDARLRSFANWPRSSVQSAETLATAGFYYQNIDDHVLCFQCNGGLRSWQREDDPFFEHARWFPKCDFVRLVKGPQYVAQVQQQSRPSLDDAMAGEPVQKALQLGLNEGRIRTVTKYHLERFGSPFKCAEALIDAVLDYQREEEQQQDTDDDEEPSSSAIVREVGRILDTIFSMNASSSSSTSNFDEDFVILDPPSNQTSSSSSTTTTVSRNSNSENSTNSISEPCTTASPQKNTNSTIQSIPSNDASESSESSSNNRPNCSSSSNTSINNPILTKKLSLEEENRQLKDARLCKVCMDDDVAVVFLPCGHLVTCVQCAPSVLICPLCRTVIKAFVRTFLS